MLVAASKLCKLIKIVRIHKILHHFITRDSILTHAKHKDQFSIWRTEDYYIRLDIELLIAPNFMQVWVGEKPCEISSNSRDRSCARECSPIKALVYDMTYMWVISRGACVWLTRHLNVMQILSRSLLNVNINIFHEF